MSPYAPERCGIGDYTAAFARGVSGRGHEVGVVSASSTEGAPDEVLAGLPESRREVRQVVELIRAWEPDVVHLEFAVASYGTRIPVLLTLLRALRPLPPRVVVTMHEVTRDTDSLRVVGRAIYRRLAALADGVIVHTESALGTLNGPVGAQTSATLLPHPRAELPQATVTAAELRDRFGLADARVLIAFGFIHVDKGLDDLVTALGELAPRLPDVRLVVAGDVRPRHGLWRAFELRDRLHLRRVRRLIGRFALEGRVVFTGYVPDGEIRPWFELAEAAVLPYTRIEQSGVANLAAAAGTPILASRVGGLVQDGSDPRWTFPGGDPGRLAAVVEDFLSSPWRGLDTGAEAPPLSAVVDQTLALYESRIGREADVQYA